jgi:murein DD-endopeptidase MepM/ murein hydrolase activator NlpD
MLSEKRVFVKSSAGTRFVRIGPKQQIVALMGGLVLLSWTAFATAIAVIDFADTRGAGETVVREAAIYENRLNTLADERDDHQHAALEAQAQFGAALVDVGRLQEQLFDTKLALREMESSRDALRTLLQRAMVERDTLNRRMAALETDDSRQVSAALSRDLGEADASLSFLSTALTRTAVDRDALADLAMSAETRVADLELALMAHEDANERIFSQLEEAVTLSMEPLDKLFRAAGLPPEKVLDQMRSRYSGQGGPLMPISFSTKGTTALGADGERASAILVSLDQLNLYRMALEKLPFALPVSANVRQTSGFGYRRDPFRGGQRLHAGMDWAGSYGTPIKATADGVVVHAGWQSGYGRLIKVQHEFGVETRFAHLSQINVKVGQRVSRGDKIGAMGNSGRSTGTHLHYEVRVGGTPVNPMTYIKAARDVL